MRPSHYQRGGQRVSFPILMLGMQIMRYGFDKVPPTTLLTILGQVGVFLRIVPVPPIRDVCISPLNVWYLQEWERLYLAPFFHLSDWHLYYNMVSLLWKGVGVERRVGSAYFAYLLAAFSLLTSAAAVCLGLAAECLLHDPAYLSQCAAGFSGVLFALKVVTTAMSPAGSHRILGVLPVPSRYACWVELVVIHFVVPNSSFIGHLAGILVGVAYVHGPLRALLDTPYKVFAGQGRRASLGGPTQPRAGPNGWTYDQAYHHTARYQPPRYSGSAGQSGRAAGRDDGDMDAAIRASLKDVPPGGFPPMPMPDAPSYVTPSAPPYVTPSAPPLPNQDAPAPAPANHEAPWSVPTNEGGLYPNLDEMRRRRLERFDVA